MLGVSPIYDWAGANNTNGNWDVYWDSTLVNTNSVTLEIYQNGTKKGVIAAGVPNNGHIWVEFLSYCEIDGAWFRNMQFKIISDADNQIYDFSSTISAYID